jgi:hypothetical protein
MIAMEEISFQPQEIPPKPETNADPVKIGDLLVGYELSKSEPVHSKAPLAAEKDPKLLISREKLKARIERYREQKAIKPKEIVPDPNPTPELKEVNFDRRSEVIAQNTPPEPDTLEEIGSTVINAANPSPLQDTSTSPPLPITTIVPPVGGQDNQDEDDTKKPIITYKKSLLWGLIAGALTGVVLVFTFIK